MQPFKATFYVDDANPSIYATLLALEKEKPGFIENVSGGWWVGYWLDSFHHIDPLHQETSFEHGRSFVIWHNLDQTGPSLNEFSTGYEELCTQVGAAGIDASGCVFCDRLNAFVVHIKFRERPQNLVSTAFATKDTMMLSTSL
jgi:hypothetical protein